MKYLNRLVLLLVSLLFLIDNVHADTAGDLSTQNRASFISRDGYNLFLGTEDDDDIIFRQNDTTTMSIDGATGLVSFSGTLNPNLANNTYLTSKNAAGSANIDVLKVDGTDDTVLNADTGDSIKLSVAGTAHLTVDGTTSTVTNIFKANPSSTTNYLQITSPSSSYLNIAFGDGGTTATQKMNISASTAAGDNDSSLYLCAGGLGAGSDCSSAYGAAILMDGENTTGKGDIQISTGDASGSDMYLDMAATNSTVIFRDAGTNHQLWTYSVDGNITQNATYGGSLIMSKAATGILSGASSLDADVTGVSAANPNFGGLADQSSNGGIINISNGANGAGAAFYGFQTRSASGSSANTIVNNGDVITHWRAYAADGASYRLAAQIRALVDGAPGSSDMPGALEFLTTADGGTTHAVALKLGNDKKAAFTGQLTSSATSDLGWTPVNAANQACNTTCTSACVFGMNTGALGNFVSCSDATADTCICAGAS